MKRFTIVATLLALVIVPAALSAGSGHSLTLNKDVLVNGTSLKSGDYKVKWQGTGDRVEVNFNRGKQVVATVPAQIVALDSIPTQDTFVYHDNPDGTHSLLEIRFSGQKSALVLGEQTANAMGSSQASNTTAK